MCSRTAYWFARFNELKLSWRYIYSYNLYSDRIQHISLSRFCWFVSLLIVVVSSKLETVNYVAYGGMIPKRICMKTMARHFGNENDIWSCNQPTSFTYQTQPQARTKLGIIWFVFSWRMQVFPVKLLLVDGFPFHDLFSFTNDR